MIVKWDEVIRKVGENLYKKHGSIQRRHIGQELRLLARQTIKMAINITHYFATRTLENVEMVNDTNVFQKTSTLGRTKRGPFLKKCCILLKK